MNSCPNGKIMNPKTKRCVKIDGKIGRSLSGLKCPNEKIENPKTKRCVLRTGKIGKSVIEEIEFMVKNKVNTPMKEALRFKVFEDELVVVSPNVGDRFAGITSYEGTSIATSSAWLDFISKTFKDVCIVSKLSYKSITNNLHWDSSKQESLIYSEKLLKKLKKCVRSEKRFVVMPFVTLGFEKTKSFAHMNIIIYDTVNNTVERFEPHGKMNYAFDAPDQQRFDDKINADLKQFFNEKLNIPGLVYISPSEYCPSFGLQYRQDRESEVYNEINGLKSFCATWSIFYSMHRLLNPDMDKSDLIRQLNLYFDKYPKKISEFIRDYTFHLNEKLGLL
jgi:hypothetical protein